MKFTTHNDLHQRYQSIRVVNLLVEIILCSQLHCINVFQFLPFLYELRGRGVKPRWRHARSGTWQGRWASQNMRGSADPSPPPRLRRRPPSNASPALGGVAHLTACTYRSVLVSKLPHKIVNLLFAITNYNIKLTVLWGSWLSETS